MFVGLNVGWTSNKIQFRTNMVAQALVVATSESVVGRRVVPGRSLPVGVDPSSEGSILAWLKR